MKKRPDLEDEIDKLVKESMKLAQNLLDNFTPANAVKVNQRLDQINLRLKQIKKELL